MRCRCKSLRYQHHRWRQVTCHFLDATSDRLSHGGCQDGYDLIAFGARNGGRQSALASVVVLVGQECPYLAIAQTCLVEAHVRTDIGNVEIETTAKLAGVLIGITAYFIAIQFSKMLAVDTVHLRYVLNRQRCRLHLHLLKKPRTRC